MVRWDIKSVCLSVCLPIHLSLFLFVKTNNRWAVSSVSDEVTPSCMLYSCVAGTRRLQFSEISHSRSTFVQNNWITLPTTFPGNNFQVISLLLSLRKWICSLLFFPNHKGMNEWLRFMKGIFFLTLDKKETFKKKMGREYKILDKGEQNATRWQLNIKICSTNAFVISLQTLVHTRTVWKKILKYYHSDWISCQWNQMMKQEPATTIFEVPWGLCFI